MNQKFLLLFASIMLILNVLFFIMKKIRTIMILIQKVKRYIFSPAMDNIFLLLIKKAEAHPNTSISQIIM
jgi:hypothetical protein